MHYDERETRSAEQREADLLRRLPAQLEHATANAPVYSQRLAHVDARSIDSRAQLARLLLTRKSELIERQGESRPVGGLNATPAAKLARIFMSPGPIYDPEGRAPTIGARRARCSP